jgi:uncharacterized protein YbjT (DUF2867 family)
MKVTNMKIVVIGGSGLIGSKLVTKLREHGHEAIAASPNSGVNTLTGEGLAEVLQGASVVIDVSNSPSWEDAAVLNFFETSTRNLLKYGGEAGVKHLVALSVVGTDRLAGSGYFRAKIAQEKLIKNSSIPYSIVQATQFFEFLKQLADISFDGKKVRVPDALFQPMAADDVASAVGRALPASPSTAPWKWEGRNSFAWTNSSADAWRPSMTRGKSSLTRTRFIPARRSASELSSQTKTPDLAKRVLQTGLRAPRRSHRVQSCHLQRGRRRRIESEIMADNEIRVSEVSAGLIVDGRSVSRTVVTEAVGFVTSQAAGEGMGRYTGGRLAPTHDEIAQLAYYLYELRGREVGYHIEDWLRAEQQLIHHYE